MHKFMLIYEGPIWVWQKKTKIFFVKVNRNEKQPRFKCSWLFKVLYSIYRNMDQNLYFQRYHQPTKKEQSLFSCLNCFPEPSYAECIVIQKPIIQKNDQNNYLYPSIITQDERRYSLHSNTPNSMHQSRKSMNTSENKKDVISLKKSRKTINSSRQTPPPSERQSFPDSVPYEDVNQIPYSLQNQLTNPNLPSPRLSLPQSVITNTPKQVFQNSTYLQTSRPSVAFSYKRQPLELKCLPFAQRFQPKSNQNAVPAGIFRQTDSFMRTTEANFEKTIQPSHQKLSQIYANKQILQSLELQMKKKTSNNSNQSVRIKKNNFGDGKLRFQVRQTVSIRQPEQEDIRQSIVLQNINFSNNNGHIDHLLKPITESEMEIESFIQDDRLRR